MLDPSACEVSLETHDALYSLSHWCSLMCQANALRLCPPAICRNTLVCDTEEEGKRLAFGSERHKVVTLDGTMITRTGVMSGGLSHDIERRAQRWDDNTTKALKQARRRRRDDFPAACMLSCRRIQETGEPSAAPPVCQRGPRQVNVLRLLWRCGADVCARGPTAAQEHSKHVEELAGLPEERTAATQAQQLAADIAGLSKQVRPQQLRHGPLLPLPSCQMPTHDRLTVRWLRSGPGGCPLLC